MGADTQSLAWLALATTTGLRPRDALTLVERLGSARAVLEATAAPSELRAALEGALVRADAEARAIARAGASLVVWSDAGYPARLREIADAPLALAVRGSLGDTDEIAVAVVGTRHASEYGRRVATELA